MTKHYKLDESKLKDLHLRISESNEAKFKRELIFNIEKDQPYSTRYLKKKYSKYGISITELYKAIINYQILKYGEVLYRGNVIDLTSNNTSQKFSDNRLKRRQDHTEASHNYKRLIKFIERNE